MVRRTVEERLALGKRARDAVPRSTHLAWEPATDRPDPVELLKEQDASREPDLVPERHSRMMFSPFSFYRGAARIMAVDLSGSPRTGLNVQMCGDAHLSNFGVFASPERTLLFDLNDFDETLHGPFEFDLKRLAASFCVAGRTNGVSDAANRTVATTVAARYRQAMLEFAGMGPLEVWYSHLPAQQVLDLIARSAKGKGQQKTLRRGKAIVQKASTRNSLRALSTLGEMVDGRYRIVSQPPLVVPLRDIESSYGLEPLGVERVLRRLFREYRATLDPERRFLVNHFQLVDVARKVVGVGSVGTRCFIALFEGRDRDDPLFLQVKEATSSVFEDRLSKSPYRNHGERVVRGQRMMQAASDIFLGWMKDAEGDRHYYWRQLHDSKGSIRVDGMSAYDLHEYAKVCAWTLARAHARSGDPIAISAYLGHGDTFDCAIGEYACRYADQNERDYEAFVQAVRSGSLRVLDSV
ncbi:MAG: DUF2252 domain-containing protein [Acidimicrobiales bacterium]